MRSRVAGLAVVATTMALSAAACAEGDSTPGATTTFTATGTAAASASIGPITAADLCGRAQHTVVGNVGSPDLVEISGLAASRNQDVIWAHNDSGDTPRVFAMSPTGYALATYEVRGADATDWEDMALGPGPEEGVEYLYLADIGDNASIRPEIAVYRAPEPSYDPASSLHAIDAERLTLVYPDGSHDAEALLVDPRSGDLIIISKNIAGGPSGVFRARAPLETGDTIGLVKEAEIDFSALLPAKVVPEGTGPLPSVLGKVPTGGDISPDGSIVAVRTYGTAWLWQRNSEDIALAFTAPPCEGPSEVESQGEAIAFHADGRGYLTASEGQNVAIHEFRLD
jgi:hypothetical protein